MATLPTSLKQLSLFFERLPGIGEKTANRLALYLLRLPEDELIRVGDLFSQLKKRTKLCKTCMNLTEQERCVVCEDHTRDKTIITVVESPLDILSFEAGGIYRGLYHVLHGKLDPLNNIGPQDIYVDQFLTRMKQGESEVTEILLATNPDMEGEATAQYIQKKLVEIMKTVHRTFSVSRLAYGLPLGGNVEYADYGTLKKAIEGRRRM